MQPASSKTNAPEHLTLRKKEEIVRNFPSLVKTATRSESTKCAMRDGPTNGLSLSSTTIQRKKKKEVCDAMFIHHQHHWLTFCSFYFLTAKLDTTHIQNFRLMKRASSPSHQYSACSSADSPKPQRAESKKTSRLASRFFTNFSGDEILHFQFR